MPMKTNEILIVHGSNYRDMTKMILEKADVASMIKDKNARIGLKPNLVNASSPSYGATTHTELAAGVIQYLQEHGFSDIVIMEGSWVGEKTSHAFNASGYDHLCEAYGIPFIDLQKDSYTVYDAQGLNIAVCDQAMNVDFMINMPVLKGHAQTKITCALKNNKGVIPNKEKSRFHRIGLHEPIAHLNTIVHNDFILVDNICGDLDFEEGGNPVTMNRILGFRDPVLCDAYVCDCMGYSPDDVPYVRMAEQLGVGSADLSRAQILYLNEPQSECVSEKDPFPRTRRIERLTAYTKEKEACSACYGSLIHALSRLQEEGFLKKGFPTVSIGQGYRGKEGNIGIGNCTKCFRYSCEGCPPTASQIREFLKGILA